MAKMKAGKKLVKKARKPSAMPFWHITSMDAVATIMERGLEGSTTPRNRGETLDCNSIFVLTSDQQGLVERVVMTQIWPDDDITGYALLRVDPAGVTGPVLDDHVAEFTAPWHRVIQQDVILPEFLTAETFSFEFPGKRLFLLHTELFQRPFTAEEWVLARNWFEAPMIAYQEAFEAGTFGNMTTKSPRKKNVRKKQK